MRTICETYGIAPGGKSAATTIDEVGQALAPLSGIPEIFTPIMKASDALWSNLGVNGKKRFCQEFAGAYPDVAGRFLQALAHHDCSVSALWDTASGCFVEARQPADVLSLRGAIGADVIAVSPNLVRVEVATETRGQIFDWGKSRRLIDQVFTRTQYYLTKI